MSGRLDGLKYRKAAGCGDLHRILASNEIASFDPEIGICRATPESAYYEFVRLMPVYTSRCLVKQPNRVVTNI